MLDLLNIDGCNVISKQNDFIGVNFLLVFVSQLLFADKSTLQQPCNECASSCERVNNVDIFIAQGLSELHFQSIVNAMNNEDLFYYVYGLLHSDDYKTCYADNLTKELPRIPRVAKAADFWAFSKAGRTLAGLHIGYEEMQPYPTQIEGGAMLMNGFSPQDFRVEQMKFAKGKNGEKHDKTRVIYNHKITMSGIPLEAYDYVVNGKPALEWVMERQSVSEHKDSGIVNDANLWATETMQNASYPFKLFQRVITVSLETMKIVRSLPRL
nr:type ISP restriction/modification enzyme [Glaciimonas sp. PCH181]